MDVNVRFTDIDKFEFTDEVAIFDLLGIPLVHGWLIDPQASYYTPVFTPPYLMTTRIEPDRNCTILCHFFG